VAKKDPLLLTGTCFDNIYRQRLCVQFAVSLFPISCSRQLSPIHSSLIYIFRAHNFAMSVSKSILETKMDTLEARLKERMEQISGFADPEVQARALEQSFKKFDTNGSGFIDYQEFFAAMTSFNFVGVQREIEGLFNRYDDDASGELDYKEFSYHLYGIGKAPVLDVNSKNVIEKVKARILAKDGASGIHSISRILSRMDTDGSKSLDRDELMYGLREYGINNVSQADLQKIFNSFDRDRSGRISVQEFLQGLKVGFAAN
jgi:Ca2+-binding EF-hand superfamily protein